MSEISPPPQRRVLLLEDDASVRQSLARYLAAAGYAVVPTGNPDQAFHALEHEPIDAVLADVRLGPHRSGLEVLEFAYLEDDRPMPLLMILTGVTLTDEEEAIIRRYPAYVFYKPHGYGELVAFMNARLGAASV